MVLRSSGCSVQTELSKNNTDKKHDQQKGRHHALGRKIDAQSQSQDKQLPNPGQVPILTQLKMKLPASELVPHDVLHDSQTITVPPIRGETWVNGINAYLIADDSLSLGAPRAGVPILLRRAIEAALGGVQPNGVTESRDPSLTMTMARYTFQSQSPPWEPKRRAPSP